MQIFKFFADSKSRTQELSNDVLSFVIFGYKTWDLEGGSNFKDRVKGPILLSRNLFEELIKAGHKEDISSILTFVNGRMEKYKTRYSWLVN